LLQNKLKSFTVIDTEMAGMNIPGGSFYPRALLHKYHSRRKSGSSILLNHRQFNTEAQEFHLPQKMR